MNATERKKLGAFVGVFTPTMLTILGVIMYLRTGWVVGNAGLLPTLAIVVLANGITLITALSVSAVATNMRVGSGGPTTSSPAVSVWKSVAPSGCPCFCPRPCR